MFFCVFRVEPGKPAQIAGVQIHDELISVGGVELNGYRREAVTLITKLAKNGQLTLVVKRKIKNLQRNNHSSSSPRYSHHFSSSQFQTNYSSPINHNNISPLNVPNTTFKSKNNNNSNSHHFLSNSVQSLPASNQQLIPTKLTQSSSSLLASQTPTTKT